MNRAIDLHLHFVQGKRQIRRGTGEFWAKTEKICATADAVSLGYPERNSPDERRGETWYRPQLSLRRECHDRGEGLTRQPNEPVGYWVLAEPDAQRPTLALGSPGFEKRQVFWYDVPEN